MIWFFLLSGLFLGWSLGANDASNIFGTAVATRMVQFRTAALIGGVGVIIGAVVSGSGTADTLHSLGAVDAVAGAFTVALAAAISVAVMNHAGMPVSTSQTVVGAIIGWNFFAGAPTDARVLTKIVSAWALSPLLAAGIAIGLYLVAERAVRRWEVHLLDLDAITRLGLLVTGAFGAYSLGANNIGNVMGVFVSANPFADIGLFWGMSFTGMQQLFLIGGIAIAVGIYTGSYKVMMTVGNQIFKLTPLLALIVVMSHSLVLFLFASTTLKELLGWLGLPTLPLVPVSSTQAVIGAIIGLAMFKGGGSGVQVETLAKVTVGWVVAPIAAGLISFVALFFVQNVFQLEVVSAVTAAMQP